MVDLHHHLLPGIDDGSPDLETSIAMARMAAGEGITHVVATPHASSRYTFSPALIAERLAQLRAALDERGVPLTLATGCDFHVNFENIRDALDNPRKYTLNDTEYLLVELPDLAISPHLGETLYELRLAGMASDPVAAILLARSLLDQAQHAFGPASVGAAFARLAGEVGQFR